MEICNAREWLLNIFSTNIVASHSLLFDKAIRLNKQIIKKQLTRDNAVVIMFANVPMR